jgi:selenocysteine lyase/cysteine desulfurase
MTSRRSFIKKATVLSGSVAWPLLSSTEVSGKSLAADLSTAANEDEYFDLIRKQFLLPPDRVYLNTGSLGPSPLQVIEKVAASMRQLETNPVSENWGPLGNQMEEVRGKIATFIHASKEEILLTRNTTEGLSLISQSLNWKSGDEIITTTVEHDGELVGLEFAAKVKGVVIRKVNLPTPSANVEEVVETLRKAITPRTRMMLLSHVNTSSGMVMPLAQIARYTQPANIILVADGAQAVGQLPVDVEALKVDAYAANGHKWLLGPKETGFLYLNKNLQSKVESVFTSAGFQSYTKASGTRNVATIIGLGEAIDFQNLVGKDRIRQRCLALRNHCQSELKKRKGLKVISPEVEELSCGIVSFTLDTISNQDIYHKLKEQDIIVKLLPYDNSIRISCHVFVSKTDINKFLSALDKLLAA